MKKILFSLLCLACFTGASAQMNLSKRYKGGVMIGSKIYQAGTIQIDFPDTTNVTITPQLGTATFKGRYSQFINPDTELPFISQAALKLFIQDNFFNNPTTTIDTAARYAIKVETMEGDAGNEYTLLYEPAPGTITATINGVQELVDYPGTGLVVTVDPAYPVDDTDVIIFTYSYQP